MRGLRIRRIELPDGRQLTLDAGDPDQVVAVVGAAGLTAARLVGAVQDSLRGNVPDELDWDQVPGPEADRLADLVGPGPPGAPGPLGVPALREAVTAAARSWGGEPSVQALREALLPIASHPVEEGAVLPSDPGELREAVADFEEGVTHHGSLLRRERALLRATLLSRRSLEEQALVERRALLLEARRRQATLASLETEAQELRQQVEQLDPDRIEHLQEALRLVASLEEELAGLQAQIEPAEAEVSRLEEDLEQDVDGLASASDESLGVLLELAEQLERLRSSHTLLERALEEERQRLEREGADLSAWRESAQRLLALAPSQRQRLRGYVALLEERLAVLARLEEDGRREAGGADPDEHQDAGGGTRERNVTSFLLGVAGAAGVATLLGGTAGWVAGAAGVVCLALGLLRPTAGRTLHRSAEDGRTSVGQVRDLSRARQAVASVQGVVEAELQELGEESVAELRVSLERFQKLRGLLQLEERLPGLAATLADEEEVLQRRLTEQLGPGGAGATHEVLERIATHLRKRRRHARLVRELQELRSVLEYGQRQLRQHRQEVVDELRRLDPGGDVGQLDQREARDLVERVLTRTRRLQDLEERQLPEARESAPRIEQVSTMEEAVAEAELQLQALDEALQGVESAPVIPAGELRALEQELTQVSAQRARLGEELRTRASVLEGEVVPTWLETRARQAEQLWTRRRTRAARLVLEQVEHALEELLRMWLEPCDERLRGWLHEPLGDLAGDDVGVQRSPAAGLAPGYRDLQNVLTWCSLAVALAGEDQLLPPLVLDDSLALLDDEGFGLAMLLLARHVTPHRQVLLLTGQRARVEALCGSPLTLVEPGQPGS